MNLFVALIDGLFGMHVNNITESLISDVARALDLPLYLVF